MSLILKDIKKSFDNKIIFDGFSYTFDNTGIYAVTGESGVGKTTLLRLIAGLDKDYSGEITGGGIKNVSFAFQEYRLFPTLTALENAVIANGDMSDGELVAKAKTLFTRLDFLDSDLSLLPRELSGGMRQRVSLVRAILKKSPVLILDEPTKELDAGIIKELYNIIIEESKKRLIIMVTHREDDIKSLSPTVITL